MSATGINPRGTVGRHTVASMCAGKDGLSEGQARKVAARMARKGRVVACYRCLVCREWHVGSPMKRGQA